MHCFLLKKKKKEDCCKDSSVIEQLLSMYKVLSSLYSKTHISTLTHTHSGLWTVSNPCYTKAKLNMFIIIFLLFSLHGCLSYCEWYFNTSKCCFCRTCVFCFYFREEAAGKVGNSEYEFFPFDAKQQSSNDFYLLQACYWGGERPRQPPISLLFVCAGVSICLWKRDCLAGERLWIGQYRERTG